jgi:alkanesulfonate monooxygenase SsuD/methylene tetrahydromethanopterin reductase-like flavin-dependent oxidoreductase (luciferase family)
MRLGALLGPIRDATVAHTLADQARSYVAAGFESLWSAHAMGRGFMLTDPLIAMTVAASVSEHVEIGTAVLQLPLYHPADLAHRVFSLMQLCGGRLLLGVGAGSTAKDFELVGRTHTERFRAFDAGVATLRTLLRDGSAGDLDLSPWPAVAGGPPLLFGSWGNGVERAAREFDGWIASAHYRTTEQVIDAHGRYRRAGGRRAIVSTIQLSGATDLGKLREQLARFAAAGFDDAVVMFLPGAPSPEKVRALVG